MMTKFNVGDKVRVTGTGEENVPYGTILTVAEGPHGSMRGGNYYFCEIGDVVLGDDLELFVENKPKKSARITALETQVAELQAKVEALEKAENSPTEHDTLSSKYPLTAQFERESPDSNCEAVDGILADIERKAKPKTQSPNEQRADVIKRAKAFVTRNVNDAELGDMLSVEFVINSDKRTVVAIIHGCYSKQIRAKGIAKCDPDDVFNADIGKAIALARALGVEVPVEFVKAVQPTEVVVGQIVYDNDVENDSIGSGIVTAVKPEGFMNADEGYTLDGGWAYLEFARITDDTDAVYE